MNELCHCFFSWSHMLPSSQQPSSNLSRFDSTHAIATPKNIFDLPVVRISRTFLQILRFSSYVEPLRVGKAETETRVYSN